jgi:hypothetical protein
MIAGNLFREIPEELDQSFSVQKTALGHGRYSL